MSLIIFKEKNEQSGAKMNGWKQINVKKKWTPEMTETKKSEKKDRKINEQTTV